MFSFQLLFLHSPIFLASSFPCSFVLSLSLTHIRTHRQVRVYSHKHLQPVVSWVCSRKVSQCIEIGRLAAPCLILGFGFEIPRENGSLRDASPAGTLTTTCPAAKGERSGQAVCQVRKPRSHTHTRKHSRMFESTHAHTHTSTHTHTGHKKTF